MFWRGVWGYLPANIVQGVVGFLAIVVFTRLLSPEDFGRYALAFSVFSLAHVAVFSWLEAAMARFWAAETPGPGMAAHFASLYRTAIVLAVLFVPAAGLAVWLAPMPEAFRIPLAIALLGVPVRCLVRMGQERYRAAGEVGKAAVLDIWTVIGGFAFGAVLAVWGFGASAPLAGLLIAPLIALPFVLPAELREARQGAMDPARLKSYAGYGYPIAAALALSLVLASTDRFLLAIFMDEAAVGAYHAAYTIANRTIDVLFVWLGAAGAPAMVMALERGGRETLKGAAHEQASTLILIGLPAAAGVALVARPMAEVLIGESLRDAVAVVTPWIALSALLAGLSTHYFGHAFTLGRRTGRLLMVMIVPAGANVLLNLLLIPRLGLQGAAISTALAFALGLATCVMVGRRTLVMPIPWSALWRCGVATAAMAAAVWFLPPFGGLGELALDASVGAAVYAVVAFALNAAGVRDLLRRLAARRGLRTAS